MSGEVSKELVESQQYALGTGKVDLNYDQFEKEAHDKELFEKNKKLLEELIQIDVTTLPALYSADLVKETDIGTLVTLEYFRDSVNYLAHKKIAEQWKLYKNSGVAFKDSHEEWLELDKQTSQLRDMALSNIENLFKFLFSGNSVYIWDIDHPILGGYPLDKSTPRLTKFSSLVDVPWSYRIECKCGVKAGKQLNIEFHRYTEFMTFFNIKRIDLPRMFQSYLATGYMPAIGNTILDNVLPEFVEIEYDRASREHINGFRVNYCVCGRCLKRYLKQFKVADESVIVISSSKSEIIEIVDKSKFNHLKYE